mgnify:FL=1
MTPWRCAEEIADFLGEEIKRYDEKSGTGEAHAGFLPIVQVAQLKKEQCPYIAIRPHKVKDEKKERLASMAVYVVVCPEAEKCGAESLYHILEFLRFSLLSKNPIKNRWMIASGELETSIPDEQPYPKYWGRIDFDVILPIVKNPRNDILGRM